MQLLQITVTPMQYELEIEQARLEYKQDFLPRANVQTTPGQFEIQTKPAQVRLDTYNARRSIGFARVGDRISEAAQKGSKHLAQYTRENVDMGKQMANIEDGVTIGQLIRQKMIDGGRSQSYTAFLPSQGPGISWEPPNIRMGYEPGNTNYDWKIKSNVLSYVPGSVRVRITQFASVDVEYLGSPMYFPPSAAPNYEEKSAG